MRKLFVDSNVFLRFLLKDNDQYYQQAKKYFTQAKEKKIRLILIPQVVFEINYVLEGVYQLNKKEAADLLLKLVKSPLLTVENQLALIEALEKYQKINIDLFDIYLWERAKQEKAEVLSFDRDFKKINGYLIHQR